MANGNGNVICFETLKGPWLDEPAIEYAGIVAVFETVEVEFDVNLPAA